MVFGCVKEQKKERWSGDEEELILVFDFKKPTFFGPIEAAVFAAAAFYLSFNNEIRILEGESRERDRERRERGT